MEPVLVRSLRDRMNSAYGLRPWPKTLDVSREEYDAVEAFLEAEQARRIAEWHAAGSPEEWHEPLTLIFVGPNFGVMFKGVELQVA